MSRLLKKEKYFADFVILLRHDFAGNGNFHDLNENHMASYFVAYITGISVNSL